MTARSAARTEMNTPSRSRAWVEIDLQRIRDNARSLVKCSGPDRQVMAVVKADAYGHGLLPVAREAAAAGAQWLGVATVSEGADLRAAGISAPIALLCLPSPVELQHVAEHRLTPLIGDERLAIGLGRIAAGLEVHLDIDTGMGRSGALPEDAAALFRICERAGLQVSGICTHFADADGRDPELTVLQCERFAEARRAAEDAGARFAWVHAGNSAATLRFALDGCNLARPGLLLYGLHPDLPGLCDPEPGETTLPRQEPGMGERMLPRPVVQPVLTLRARVGAVRDLPAGHTVSYGATFRLTRRSRVATVLIGYGDGYPRRLSNCGEMLLHGRRVPILGRVCMDQTVVDVTDIPDATPGDIAVCIGQDGDAAISAEEIARHIGATEHEITTCLSSRLPRIYSDEAIEANRAARGDK